MTRGGFLFVACSSLAIAGCSAPAVKVRAISDPSAKLRNGGDELAAARNMLALGNVGLALEGFRNLRITQPANPDVYAGIADCYAAMGRYDLAATNYEMALAYAPHDTSLLSAFAASLERQGETAKAAAVRAELAELRAPKPQPPSGEIAAATGAATQESDSVAIGTPQVGSITVKLPPARPVARIMAQEARPAARARAESRNEEATHPAKAVEARAQARPIVSQTVEAKFASVAAPKQQLVESEPAPVRIAAFVPSEVPVQLGPSGIAKLNPEGLKPAQAVIAVVAPEPREEARSEASVAPTQQVGDGEPTPVRIAASLPSHVPVQLGMNGIAKLNPERLKMPQMVIAVIVPEPPREVVDEAIMPTRPLVPRPLAPAAVTLISKREAPRSSFPTASALVAELVAMEAIKPREPERRLEEQAIANGPRLERLSTGEVALVTTPRPLWKSQLASKAPSHATVQWLPIRMAEARPAIQLLNAARSRGLAAWSRMALLDRGWRRIDIGDFGEVRQRSLVLYTGDHAPLARRLAAQFNCRTMKINGNPQVIVLLGRDAAVKKATSRRA